MEHKCAQDWEAEEDNLGDEYKLCHWFLKVPFFSLDDRKVIFERFRFYLK